MEGNYAMQHIRQDIKTHKSRKKGNGSIKNMSQDINHEKATKEIFVVQNTFGTFA
jgi:hypothetical protein